MWKRFTYNQRKAMKIKGFGDFVVKMQVELLEKRSGIPYFPIKEGKEFCAFIGGGCLKIRNIFNRPASIKVETRSD